MLSNHFHHQTSLLLRSELRYSFSVLPGKFNKNTTQRSFSETQIDVESLRKRLLYRSSFRGTKENDLLLSTFAKKYLSSLTESELIDYEYILSHQDPDLFLWITKKEPLPEDLDIPVFHKIINHCQNNPLEYRSQ